MMNASSIQPPAKACRTRFAGPLFCGSVLGLCLFAAVAGRGQTPPAERDPFWPIGYEPPKPEPPAPEIAAPAPTKTEAPAPKPKPAPPVIKPVSEAEWQAALKTLVISGYTQVRKPGSGETRESVMLNRQLLSVGDTFCITNQSVQFVWRVESLANRDLKVSNVQATRLTFTHPTSLKQ